MAAVLKLINSLPVEPSRRSSLHREYTAAREELEKFVSVKSIYFFKMAAEARNANITKYQGKKTKIFYFLLTNIKVIILAE